jgi:hypothetical protein
MNRSDEMNAPAAQESSRKGLVRGAISLVRRHPVPSGLFAIAGVGLAIFVLLYFQPQKLFIDNKVSESLPTATAGTVGGTPIASEPRAVSSGSFRGLAHSGSGSAAIIEIQGRRVLRLEDLNVENGPDLFVYLSTTPADSEEGAFPGTFVNLGKLKGNIGDQNYEIPAGADLSRYRSVVIYCKRFTTPFAAAALA